MGQNVLCQDSVRKSERSSGSQSVSIREWGRDSPQSGSSGHRGGSKDVRGDKKFNPQNKTSSTFEAISRNYSCESDSSGRSSPS